MMSKEPKARNQWADVQPPPRDWIIRNWLPAGRVTLLSGAGGGGKSRLALQLSVAIASGNLNGDQEWIGEHGDKLERYMPRVAVVSSWEDEPSEFHRRLLDCPDILIHGVQDVIGERLHFLDMSESGALWAPAGGSGHTSTMSVQQEAGKSLQEYCEKHEARLLVIDPVAAAFASNENDRGLVRAFMSHWNAWAMRTSCAVLMISHPAKAADSAYSGSTDWHAASRAVWTLGRVNVEDENGELSQQTQLACIKSSYGKLPKTVGLENWQWWKAVPARDKATKKPVRGEEKKKPASATTKPTPANDTSASAFV